MINLVFFGTPDFSQKFLNALHDDEDIFVSGVVAQPDKPVGRKKTLTSPPTVLFAKEHNIPVLQPASLKNNKELIAEIEKLSPDLFVVIAYGKIIPEAILSIPKKGSINVHPSLLPKYRGPSPLQAAIANEDTETGVTIMLIDEKMDHGPILLQETMAIDASDTYEQMLKKTVEVGSPMLIDAIKKYMNGAIEPKEQDHEQATFCKLIKKEDGKIDWQQSSTSILAKLRAYTPWPGIYTTWNGKRLKIVEASLVEEAMQVLEPGQVAILEKRLFIGTVTTNVEVHTIQPEGKPAMPVNAFIAGNSTIHGATLE